MASPNITTVKNQTIKSNSIINKIFDNDYLESLEYVLNIIIRRNDVQNAFILLPVLKEAVAANKAKLAADPELDNYYQKALIKLKFIAFPLLNNEDNIDLIKNHFTRQFDLPDYDITEKLSGKLLSILIAEDRDKFKADLKIVLLNNNETITGRAEIKTIADWLKNYNAALGIGTVDNFKRVEYMVSLTKVKGMDERYINRLKVLFDFYEAIKLSSLTPAGFDEEPPIVVDDKLQIFRRGVLEPIGKVTVKQKVAKTEEINKISNLAKPAAAASQTKAVSTAGATNELTELKQLAASYPPDSLERKAVEEEIEKVRSKK